MPDDPPTRPRQIDNTPNPADFHPWHPDEPGPCYFPVLSDPVARWGASRPVVPAFPSHMVALDDDPCVVSFEMTARALGPLYFPRLPWPGEACSACGRNHTPSHLPYAGPRDANGCPLPLAFEPQNPGHPNAALATQHDTPPQADVQPLQLPASLQEGAIQPPQPEGPQPTRDRPRPPQTEHGAPGPHDSAAKLGLMMMAVRDGVSATADAHRVPRRTLQGWLSQFGGLARVHAWLHAETLGSFMRAEQSIYQAIRDRLASGNVNNTELWQTYRRLIEARAIVPATQEANAQPVAAGAQAQATVTVKILDETGKAEVIDVPAPPADEEA